MLIIFIFQLGIVPKLFFDLLKILSSIKCQNFFYSNSSIYFWHLVKNITNNFTFFHLMAYGPNGVPPIVFKNCASVLTPCLVKLFPLCLSTCTFPSYWKYAYMQAVPKKGDRSNPSTTDLKLYFLVFLKLLRLSLTGKSIIISQLPTFFLIASTVSVKSLYW